MMPVIHDLRTIDNFVLSVVTVCSISYLHPFETGMSVKNIFLFIALIWAVENGSARTIRDKHAHFSIEVPDRMVSMPDAEESGGTYLVDSVANFILLINKGDRDSRFRSVRDYIDCERAQLENELRICYGDSTLRVVGCENPEIYPDRTVLLHIRVGVLPGGLDQVVIYFIHHKNKDLQFSFMFSAGDATQSMKRMREIMSTLHLD
jgi:hypothetical protein